MFGFAIIVCAFGGGLILASRSYTSARRLRRNIELMRNVPVAIRYNAGCIISTGPEIISDKIRVSGLFYESNRYRISLFLIDHATLATYELWRFTIVYAYIYSLVYLLGVRYHRYFSFSLPSFRYKRIARFPNRLTPENEAKK